jgi:hypothetical protein
MNQRLYLFVVTEPAEAKLDEAAQMLRPFIDKGYQLCNTFLFCSTSTIEEINESIKKNKLKDFLYFLIDVTDNISEETFKGVLNQKYYRFTKQVQDLIKEFRPEVVENVEDVKSIQEKIDKILDQISKKGVSSITSSQREFLETKSKHLK